MGWKPNLDDDNIRFLLEIMVHQAAPVPVCDCGCPCQCLTFTDVDITVHRTRMELTNGRVFEFRNQLRMVGDRLGEASQLELCAGLLDQLIQTLRGHNPDESEFEARRKLNESLALVGFWSVPTRRV
jgi:hypothetical protein